MMIALIFFMGLTSCVSSDVSVDTPLVPSWYSHPEERFPLSEYIVAMGSGASEDAAISHALAELMAQFSLTISSVTQIHQRYREEQNRGEQTLDEKTDLRLESSEQVFLGLQFKKEYREPFWYVAVYLSRPRVIPRYLLLIESETEKLQKFLQAPDNSSVLEQYRQYLQAQPLARRLGLLYQQLQIISPAAAATLPFFDEEQLLRDMYQKLYLQLTVRIESNEPFVKEALSVVMTSEGFRVREEDVQFILTAQLEMEELPSEKYSIIQWQLNIQLTTRQGETVLFWTAADEEKNITLSLAIEGSIRHIHQVIESQMKEKISNKL